MHKLARHTPLHILYLIENDGSELFPSSYNACEKYSGR